MQSRLIMLHSNGWKIARSLLYWWQKLLRLIVRVDIFAIGDVVGNPMLAHKATHEGKVAAEVCAGQKSEFVARVIPSVAYTDPEVAWVGVTEAEAKKDGLKIGVGKFPYAA